MAQKNIHIDQAKQIQQLSADGVAIKEIVRRIGVSRKTLRKYLRKLQTVENLQLDAEVPMADSELATIIYNNDNAPSAQLRFESLIKHFDKSKDNLHKTGVTKQLLWTEYITRHADGYKYSQYCYLFKKYLKDNDPAFHWEYAPAEFTQVDFAGKKLSYVDKSTGEMIACQIFISILPYSGFIFAIAVHSPHCINEMLNILEGLPKQSCVTT